MAPWHDWLTDSFFRVRISTMAARKLAGLPEETQVRLRRMLDEIAELADTEPLRSPGSWRAQAPLLQLQLGRATVRYEIDPQSRTISIEHVIVPAEPPDLLEDELEKVG